MLRVGVFFLVLLLSSAAHAAKRIALVVGNSSYRYTGELANPRNDAADMSALLMADGLQVVDGFDLNKVELDRKLREFEGAKGRRVFLQCNSQVDQRTLAILGELLKAK